MHNIHAHMSTQDKWAGVQIMRLRSLSDAGPSDITSESGGNSDTRVLPRKEVNYFMHKCYCIDPLHPRAAKSKYRTWI